MVYEVISKYPDGCIADDVERELAHLRSHSITPRFAPLMRKGFIFDTGERRMASSGRSQRVVKVTEAKMKSYLTQQNLDQARSLLISLCGAVLLVGTGVIFLLATFDVLVK